MFTGTPTEVPAGNGRCEITVQVSDGAGGTSTDTFILVVNAEANVPPVAADDENTVGENTASVSGNVITGHPTTMAGQDTDANAGQTPSVRDYAPGEDITVGNVGGVARVATGLYGTLTIAANGAYTYTVNAGANDSLVSATDTNEDVFTYEIDDGTVRGVTATLTITITGVNDAPTKGTDIPDAPNVQLPIGTFSHAFDPAAAFNDVDDFSALTYAVTGKGGAAWISDTVGTSGTMRTVTGDPSAATPGGPHTITITATDGAGGTATNDFDLTVLAPLPGVSIVAVNATGNTDDPVEFTISRSNTAANPAPIMVNVNITGGQGYVTAGMQTVTLGQGASSATLQLDRLTPNTHYDRDGETITATLPASDDYNLATPTATVMVIDTLPAFSMAQTATESEDGTSLTFTVNRIGSNMGAVDVIVEVTSTNSNRAAPGNQTASFAVNDPSATVMVALMPDTAPANVTAAIAAPTATPAYIVGTTDNSVTHRVDESENTVPTLTKTDTKVAVTEAGVDASNAAVAGDPAANGSLAATDMEQTAAGALGIQGCADTVAGTACASFADGTATGLGIDGIYGSFTLTAPANSNSFTWTYMLDNANSATNALAAGATATETLRVRADDKTSRAATRYSTVLEVTVTITGANDAPVAVAGAGGGIPATINATEGEVFNFMLGAASTRFTDPEGDTLSYSTLTGLPGTIMFDATTGTFSGDAPATGTPTITVTVNDGNGGEVSETFTLNLLDAPVPPSETTGMEVTVMEVDPGPDPTDDPGADPSSGVAITATDLGFIDENDTRLESVTFTVPSINDGVLYVGSMRVTSTNNTFTRQQLGNPNQRVRFVPANKKVASKPTIAFRTTGNNGGTLMGSLNFTVPASDDAPVAVSKQVDGQPQQGIINMTAELEVPFSYTIRTGFAPEDDFNPVDRDDTALTFTATYAIGGGAATPVPAPGTGTFWLKFDGTSFSGTPPEDAEGMVYTISVTATDVGANAVTDPFDLTVGTNNPIFAFLPLPQGDPEGDSVKVDLTVPQVVITVVREDKKLIEAADVSVMVSDGISDAETAKNYVTDGLRTIEFAENQNEGTLTVPLLRNVGPGAMITAEIVAGMDYEVTETGMAAVSGRIEANGERIRGQNVKDGLSGFARAMGWDLTEAISKRSSMQQQPSKQVDMSALTDRLTSKLTSRLNALDNSLGSTSGTGSNEIMGIIDTLNDRSIENATQAAGVAGQGIYSADSVAMGGGNAGTLYTGRAADAQGWLLELGTGKVTRMLDGVYGAMEGKLMEKLSENVSIWTDISNSNIKFGNSSATSYDGEMLNFRMGFERAFSEEITVGMVGSIFDGSLDHQHHSLNLNGSLEVSGWNINPYVLWASDSYRIWGTVGFGKGDTSYIDRQAGTASLVERDTADLSSSMLAAGAEYDLLATNEYEILGRLEVMSMQLGTDDGDNGMFTDQDSSVRGVRGEVEIGWPVSVDGSGRLAREGSLRPYVTLGYRLDAGDGSGGNAVEYGVGVMVQMKDFNFDGSLRNQALTGAGDFDRTNFTFSFGYDSGNDKQGMMLAVSQDAGVAQLDPYAATVLAAPQQVPGTSSSIFGTGKMNVHAGYGFALGGEQGGSTNGLLTLHTTTDFNDGVMGQSAYGLTLETFGSNAGGEGLGTNPGRYELLFTRRPTTATAEGIDAILLKLTTEF